jgi:hypothetical protein
VEKSKFTRSRRVTTYIHKYKRAVLINKYYSGNQIEKNEMGGACSTYGGKERCIQDFGGET